MLWWLRRIFWWPRYTYDIALGVSYASAEEAEKNASIDAQRKGGEIIGIAASAMCCQKDISVSDGGAASSGGGAEWDCYLLLRK